MKFDLCCKTGALTGLRATVMGLGHHGGGAASARFLASRGARVTVTDLRPEAELAESTAELRGLGIRYVLGRHEEADFLEPDLVVKNPAVPLTSPYLKLSRSRSIPIETDVSLFLRFSANPILAVTGSKGKSTAASAIHHVLRTSLPSSRLGGNITVSPLTFIEDLAPGDPVVLELSSWQLGDLEGSGLLKPRISLITVLLPDHMNRYAGMEDYVRDKQVVYRGQGPGDHAIFNRDDPLQRRFAGETKAEAWHFSANPLPAEIQGAWLEERGGLCRIHGREQVILREPIKILGRHNRMNLLAAGLALTLYGVPAEETARGLQDFRGIEHRLEYFAERRGIRCYNDSAATIPEATAAAIRSVPFPVHLILGGTDKNIDFTPLRKVLHLPESIALLAGTGTDKLLPLVRETGVCFGGPFDTLAEAVDFTLKNARPGSSVLFSPACTSFGMFRDEFERGRLFKETLLGRLGPGRRG